MKQNKLLIVGMLVLPILLSACGGSEGVKDTNVAQTVSTSKNNEKPTVGPVAVVKQVLDEAYDERKNFTNIKIYFYEFNNYSIPWLDYNQPAETPSDECLTTILEKYKEGCFNMAKLHGYEPSCDWKYTKPKVEYPTGKCTSGSAYKMVDVYNRGFNYVLASKVPSRGMSNFDGSKWDSATMTDFRAAVDNNLPVESEDPNNWYYVVVRKD